jgi:hypothetical protein
MEGELLKGKQQEFGVSADERQDVKEDERIKERSAEMYFRYRLF